MLPGMNGFSLCETIRRTDQKIGIIILSAKGQEQDKDVYKRQAQSLLLRSAARP